MEDTSTLGARELVGIQSVVRAKGDLPDAGKDVDGHSKELDLGTGVRAEAVDDGRKEQRDGVERGDDAEGHERRRLAWTICSKCGVDLSHLM